jgi:hypothetical protein
LRGHGESSGRFLTYGEVEAKDVSATRRVQSRSQRSARGSCAIEREFAVHGTSDTQVPLRHSQALFRAARGNARLLTVPGGHATMP